MKKPIFIASKNIPTITVQNKGKDYKDFFVKIRECGKFSESLNCWLTSSDSLKFSAQITFDDSLKIQTKSFIKECEEYLGIKKNTSFLILLKDK